MTGVLQMLMAYQATASSGSLDTTAFTADDLVNGGTSEAYAEFNVDGSAQLVGNQSTSPASPRWWTTSSPPATWMSYSSTGTGTITGGLVAGTRYQLNATRKLGNQRTTLGVASRIFTITFFDASTGGTTLGTKTFTATAEFA
jgi:hypothetical protein